jgi:hypothetical protein
MTIGLIGEAPNDTSSIKNLLSRKYTDITFKTLLNNIHGSQLDNQKTKHLLRKEFEWEKPDAVIFVRDLDGLETDEGQMATRKGYFTDFNSVVNYKGIYLLNIYEIEALILSDIATFNKVYGTVLLQEKDPMLIIEPKEYLKKSTISQNAKYVESHNPEIFSYLRMDQLVANCRYFSAFINRFEKAL